MKRQNSWADPSRLSGEDVARMAAFLEERSRSADSREINRRFVEVVAPRPGEQLLEVGSGSGVVCRLIAPYLQPGGRVVGLDISPEMAAEAANYARIEGTPDGISFETGSAEALPYPDRSFDGALAARLILHAAGPERVLREMRRVVKPGGRVVVMDWDFGSVVVDHPDRELTRRLLDWRCDHHGGDNWSGRQLWRRMRAEGFTRLSTHPLVAVAHAEEDGLTQSLWRAAEVSCEGGAISLDERDSWIAALRERISAGEFFASIVYFVVIGIVGPDLGRGV